MSDFLKNKKWGWSEVGSVDDTVWDQLRNYIPSTGATTPAKTTETQPAPSAEETTPGTETQPAPSAGATTPAKPRGKDSFHSETRNRNSVPTKLFMMKNSTF